MPEQDGHVLIRGSGLAVEGPGVLHGLIFWPDEDADYADIYDGLDATTGKLFCRIETSTSTTWSWASEHGVLFDNGIYVAGKDADVETTVLFHNVE